MREGVDFGGGGIYYSGSRVPLVFEGEDVGAEALFLVLGIVLIETTNTVPIFLPNLLRQMHHQLPKSQLSSDLKDLNFDGYVDLRLTAELAYLWNHEHQCYEKAVAILSKSS